MEFFITLPSNVKSITSEPNTIANYITKLPQRIILNGKWQVALVEISYPLTWYNINRPCTINFCGVGQKK